jgi:hypothetical protein
MTGVGNCLNALDWHKLTSRPDNWGFADVEAGVNSLPTWIKNTGWQGPGVDVSRWIMTGHSNGGRFRSHGLNFTLTNDSRSGDMVCTHPSS